MSVQSKVAWLTAPYQLEFKEELLPESIADSALLCETLVSVISPGTELAAYSGLSPLRPGNPYPRLLGYCNVARVVRCGPHVKKTKVGDRILTFSSHCSHFICDESMILTTVADGLKSEMAACAYLYHLGYDALLKSALTYGQSVLVIGLGALGLACVAMAVNAGAHVYVVSDHQTPTNIALAIGAKQVFKRADSDDLQSFLMPRLADVVITTSNHWDDWRLALMMAGQHSTIAVLGFPGRGVDNIPFNPLDSQYFYDKQLRIQAVGVSPENIDSRQFLKFNEKANLSFILSEMLDGKLRPQQLLSGIFLWDQLENAYQALMSREESPITYALQWQE